MKRFIREIRVIRVRFWNYRVYSSSVCDISHPKFEMKPLFRWQTEDQSWADDLPAGGKVRPKRLVLAIVALLAAGAFLVYWRQVRQIEYEEKRLQSDVAAAFHTWQQAAANDDFDLFVHLIAYLCMQ